MGKKIGDYSEEHLLSVAKGVVEKKTGNSVICDAQAEARIPKFDIKELALNRVLGRGGFCVVSEVSKINLGKEESVEAKRSDDEHYIHNVVQDRAFMARHCIRQGKDCRYAVKRVQDLIRKDPQTFINAIVDLAVEARFLTVIRHPNIIKMRAMDVGDPYRTGFFVVLDRLYDIMPMRLKKWKKRKGGGMKKMFDLQGKKALAFWVERVTVAYDIACALSYLHGLNVIYRDLKPDNIGFDVRGDVKIFDLGLAKEVDPKTKLEDGTYNLTADTGSLRYMAPEVAQGQSYNDTCDVFSFSILCWQIFTTDTPYEGFNVKMFEKSVIKGGVRPKVDEKWSEPIQDFLKKSFVANPKRPSMVEACDVLREEINSMTDDEITDILDVSGKSNLSRGSK